MRFDLWSLGFCKAGDWDDDALQLVHPAFPGGKPPSQSANANDESLPRRPRMKSGRSRTATRWSHRDRTGEGWEKRAGWQSMTQRLAAGVGAVHACACSCASAQRLMTYPLVLTPVRAFFGAWFVRCRPVKLAPARHRRTDGLAVRRICCSYNNRHMAGLSSDLLSTPRGDGGGEACCELPSAAMGSC